MKTAICLLAYLALCFLAGLFEAVILGKVGEGCDDSDRDFLAD